jgi:tetratricopeptide (TPR) repeat protein
VRRRLAIGGTQTARLKPGALFVALAMLLGACATPQSDRLLATASAFPQQVELSAVPFFPQDEYQCGPASLAMLLNWSGEAVEPTALAPQVYLPERRGSLQLEILAAARRHGRIPYVLRPELESVFAELAAGHPVLVLQNLALDWHPQWHYAVVIGFDLPRAEVVLRSGTEARLAMPLRVFERTWARADHWAVVVLPPEQLPATAEELRYLQSVAALESLQRYEQAAAAYRATLTRWPKSLGALIGQGNSRYALGDLAGAEAAFREAVRFHPNAAVALNNLAQTLADRGALVDAEPLAARAVELDPGNTLYRATLAEIRARTQPPPQ